MAINLPIDACYFLEYELVRESECEDWQLAYDLWLWLWLVLEHCFVPSFAQPSLPLLLLLHFLLVLVLVLVFMLIFLFNLYRVYCFSLASSTAILPPTAALLCTSEIFDYRLLPFVNSFTRFNKNGVILAPDIFCCYDYFIDYWIAFYINYPYAGLLFGTATSSPFYRPSCWCA